MFTNNRDIASIVVALLAVAACYYLHKAVKVQRGDIDKGKNFSIELANRISSSRRHLPLRHLRAHEVLAKSGGVEPHEESEE